MQQSRERVLKKQGEASKQKQNKPLYNTPPPIPTYILGYPNNSSYIMSKPSIKCSRCSKTFNGGFEYRIHFDQHMDEWHESEDKHEYIKRTTNVNTQWQKQ